MDAVIENKVCDANTDADIEQRYLHIRQQSIDFCTPLELEDYGLQAMPETSPPKWHLAHTTWFFETFIVKAFDSSFQSLNSQYEVLFNSYYNGIGQQHPRHQRGLLSRPSVSEILTYRRHIDAEIISLINSPNHPHRQEILTRIELGLNHEQQHQELFFTDLKYCLFQNPLFPTYCSKKLSQSPQILPELGWNDYNGGLNVVGHVGEAFCFDNELPNHQVMLESFSLSNRLVTNGEFQMFMNEQGYQRPEFWLADGWACVNENQWKAPLYWLEREGQWFEFTLHGLKPLDLKRPVIHVSAYEADAFARWHNSRLATEFELEIAAKQQTVSGQFVESREYHPRAVTNIDNDDATGADVTVNKETRVDNQLYGSAWEWTTSAYNPYPNFKADKGAIGEYNGKFMCNQLVLRGGSCVSSRDHLRSSYRNFFYPKDRWQFSGIRLARNS